MICGNIARRRGNCQGEAEVRNDGGLDQEELILHLWLSTLESIA